MEAEAPLKAQAEEAQDFPARHDEPPGVSSPVHGGGVLGFLDILGWVLKGGTKGKTLISQKQMAIVHQ